MRTHMTPLAKNNIAAPDIRLGDGGSLNGILVLNLLLRTLVKRILSRFCACPGSQKFMGLINKVDMVCLSPVG